MDPTLNLALGILLTLATVVAFVYAWRRKPGTTGRDRTSDFE